MATARNTVVNVVLLGYDNGLRERETVKVLMKNNPKGFPLMRYGEKLLISS
jgi:hypothetical protein